jgi:penicillin-binding protein 2
MGELTHAWFAGYAAWEEPEIVFTVFLENAGHGGSNAAPIAREIIRFYDEQRKTAQ